MVMRSRYVPLLATVTATMLACSSADMAPTPLGPWAPRAEVDNRCAFAKTAPGNTLDSLERGLRLWLGDGMPKDLAAARRQLENACNEQEAACAVLGMMYETGEGVPVDIDLAQAFLRLSVGRNVFDLGGCEEGAPARTEGIRSGMTACCRGVQGCEDGCESECAAGLERVRAKTTTILERGCARGVALACYVEAVQLAYGSYFEGLGEVVPSGGSDAAERRYELACHAGIGRACSAMAIHVGFDLGALTGGTPDAKHEQHVKLARSLEERACKLGDGYGCYLVARRLEDEAGGDLRKAIPTYERACDLDMRVVCRELADMYTTGDGVPPDTEKAARFGAKAW
jgi:TPR repeat protein